MTIDIITGHPRFSFPHLDNIPIDESLLLTFFSPINLLRGLVILGLPFLAIEPNLAWEPPVDCPTQFLPAKGELPKLFGHGKEFAKAVFLIVIASLHSLEHHICQNKQILEILLIFIGFFFFQQGQFIF
jgi:hypothetical protein